MEIMRQLVKTSKSSDCFFAVYVLSQGDYRFSFASYNYYIVLDYFLSLDLPNIILCRISCDELPDYAHSDAITLHLTSALSVVVGALAAFLPISAAWWIGKKQNSKTTKEKIKC